MSLAPTPTLRFDAEAHRYTVGGAIVPSVTQCLKLAGLLDDRWFDERSAQRGTIVAQLTALDDLNDLDEGSVDPALGGYLQAWRRFRVQTTAVEAIERAVHNAIHGYAGTLDRVCTLAGESWLIDIKTGGPAPWHALQTAAYAAAYEPATARRGCVYLGAEGRFKLVEHADYGDFETFFSAARVARWALAKGKTL